MKTKNSYIEAFGRRKGSTARTKFYIFEKGARIINLGDLKLKKGDFLVNDKNIEEYFPGKVNKTRYQAPLKSTNNLTNFAVIVKINGGGVKGQLEAMIHSLARALEKVDKENRPVLKKKGFLTRDARVKERRKAGFAGKARARKQSPKR